MSPIRKSPIRTAAIAACLLLVVGASAAVAGASPNGSPVARGTIVGEADLGISQTDSPDPVNAGNNILYTIEVVNAGPDVATNVYVSGFLDDNADLLSIEIVYDDKDEFARRGDGPCGNEGNLYWCNLGDLYPFEDRTIELVAGTDDDSIPETSNDVSVGADQPDVDSKGALPNNSVEDTTVEPRNPNSDTGYIEPEGGELTTDPGTGATEEDTTVLTMKFPEGPGGTAKVKEQKCDEADPLFPCIGKIGNFVPPDGYDSIVAELIYDRSITRGRRQLPPGRKAWQVWYQKFDGPVFQLPKCSENGKVAPCVLGAKRLEDSHDVRIRVKINSDPRLTTR
ncbi:MAG: hypothetical protein WEA10_03840 [Actinomycetota bacterium]